MIDPRGYYALLGVTSSASAADIRRAFYAKAKELHPDAGELGDSAAFQAVRNAYQVLGDAGRRASYDEALEWIAREDPQPSLPQPIYSWRMALGGLLAIAFAALLVTAYFSGAGKPAPSTAGKYESAEPSGPPALSRFDAEADAAVADTLKKPPLTEDYAKSRSR